MKFNHQQNQRSFALAALLSLCAIAASLTNTAVKSISKSEAKLPNIEQQNQIEEQPKQFEPDNNGNDEVWEEIEVKQEIESILGDESEEEILIAGPSAF